MSRLDDELRAAARRLAQEPLPPDVLDEALDPPARRSRPWATAVMAGVASLVVFGGGILVGQLLPEPSPMPSPTASPAARESAPAATCEDSAPPMGGQDAVLLHFPCVGGDGSDWSTGARGAGIGHPPVVRLETALRLLLDGPSEVERDLGMAGVVPDGSSSLLAGIDLAADGLAVVNFGSELLAVNNLSTSAAAGAFLTAVRETAFEFPEVTAVELRADGSCEAVFEFFEAGPTCQHLARPIEALGDCPVIAPVELPSGAPPTAPRAYPGEPMVSWGSGEDTITELPGHRGAEPDLPSTRTPVEVRGQPGFAVEIADVPGPKAQIGWTEDGCTYLVHTWSDGGLSAALDYAGRFGPPVASAPTPPPAEPSTASVEDQGIRLTVTLDRNRTVFGQRVTATTTVENIGADSVFWGHSSTCEFPTYLEVRRQPPTELAYGRDDWPGDAGALKNVLLYQIARDPVPLLSFQPEGWLDFEGTMGCTTDFVISELPAGRRLVHVVEWDSESLYHSPPPPGDYTAHATFTFESRGEPPAFDEEPESQSVTLEMALAIDGPAVEYVSPGIALDALLADADFQAQLADTTRRDWNGQEMVFEDGRWVARLHLGRFLEGATVVPTIVGMVDARTGEVVSVTLEELPRPTGG
jgi:hypothetical protein